jgi:hypothetical protein
MITKYVITNFDENNGGIQVRFDAEMEPMFIEVPLDANNLYITGEALDTYIKGFIPTVFLERKQKLAAKIANANDIASLVQLPEEVFPELTEIKAKQQLDNMQMWADVYTDQVIAKALVKFGVIESDPTTIPVVNPSE